MTQPTVKPENSASQETKSTSTAWLLKFLSFKILLVIALIAGIAGYVLTAPSMGPSEELPKFHFHNKAAVRKRPTLDSKPLAYLQGTTDLLGGEGEWVQVRIEGDIKGWTQRHEGEEIPPPPPVPTSRQRAKQRLMDLVNGLRGLL